MTTNPQPANATNDKADPAFVAFSGLVTLLARAEARRISEAACPANTDAAPSQRSDQ